MGSHISASPNHQTFRRIPVKFRADVAMSGRLGLEMQPRDMNDEDKAVCRQAIADYKKIRPIVQSGDISTPTRPTPSPSSTASTTNL